MHTKFLDHLLGHTEFGTEVFQQRDEQALIRCKAWQARRLRCNRVKQTEEESED